MQIANESIALGACERLPLRWCGEFDVVTVRDCRSRRQREYDALIDLGRTPGTVVPVLLVEEEHGDSANLAGRCSLSGVVVQGSQRHGTTLVVDGTPSEGWKPSTGLNGLAVSGRGLVLRDTAVCKDSFGNVWRVASLMHKEWDTSLIWGCRV
ncbi:uncharacterized protein MELLADRAFT_107969 [Melampsora larici-populina 98AG31]|uniref:Uncharacterized protein n=1 Tax=Melampsora larici-populina (strain 98AG31 / pathotype 3-4-7) TaxID=747676 RepID=F4RRJ6_MELLP|nr:uncharacterized protein MELLADRAFT_107969 [Melampsora larici-populina 98AG31]EGG04942.1 hypothetical protein MELLADRAFT_107969 [Melampsora larici-populina 98AG31]